MEIKQKLPSLSSRYQWFIAQNLESHYQVFYTIDNPQYHHQCRINELHGRRIRACFHGWVILSNHPDNDLWSLWNPLTSKLISLPPLINEEKHDHECCLSAHPDDQGSVLLLTTIGAPTIIYCLLDCKRKRLKWTGMSYAKQLQGISGEDDCLLECPTCCDGKVYAMASKAYYGYVIHVDIVIKGKEVLISLLPFVELPQTSISHWPSYSDALSFRSFLKGSCSELFYISVTYKDHTGDTVWYVCLFTLDTSSMTWEAVVDLKDAMFFLELASDYQTCYYCSSVDTESNGYVHILGESGDMLYSFHAKHKTMSISSMPCIVRESQASAWAMLEWRLKADHAEPNQEEEEVDNDSTEVVVKPVKDDNIDFNITTGESHLHNIPIHLLEMIMELCVGIEHMMLRATCKYCYLAAPPSSKTTLKRLQMYSLGAPWLLVLDNYRSLITFIDPIRCDRYIIKKPQELKGDYNIYCSKYGWLLMYDINEQSLLFFNPVTNNIRELPGAPFGQSFCFSAPPTSPDCMVFGFRTAFGLCEVAIYAESWEPKWGLFALDFPADERLSFRFPTFKGGDAFALCNNTGLHRFKDIIEDRGTWDMVVDDETTLSGRKSEYFLSSCDQHVLLVVVGECGGSVEVFKLDERREEWEKLDALGEHMIYITNDTSCICLEAKSPEMRNKIYFPRLLYDGGTKIVFYSLETCSYHTFDDKNFQQSDLSRTKAHRNPHTWIVPSWS